MVCNTCQKNYTYSAGHDCPFLYAPEPVEQKTIDYNKLLAKQSKRFPAYKRYLNHGKDYYDFSGVTKIARDLRGSNR